MQPVVLRAPMKSADLHLIASTSFELRKLLRFSKLLSYLVCHHTQTPAQPTRILHV